MAPAELIEPSWGRRWLRPCAASGLVRKCRHETSICHAVCVLARLLRCAAFEHVAAKVRDDAQPGGTRAWPAAGLSLRTGRVENLCHSRPCGNSGILSGRYRDRV